MSIEGLAPRRHQQMVALMERCCENRATAAFPLQRRRRDVVVDRVVDRVVDVAFRVLHAARRWSRRRLVVLENALGRRLGCSLHHAAPERGRRRPQTPASQPEGDRRGGHR